MPAREHMTVKWLWTYGGAVYLSFLIFSYGAAHSFLYISYVFTEAFSLLDLGNPTTGGLSGQGER